MPDFEMDLTAPKPIVHGIQRPHDGFSRSQVPLQVGKAKTRFVHPTNCISEVILFEHEYNLICQMVKHGEYVMTHHALDEMIADDLHIGDIEYLVLNGKIIRSEQDKQTQERKYIIYGKTSEHVPAEVVVKIKQNVVIITVYIL